MLLVVLSEQIADAAPSRLLAGMSNPFRYFNSSPEVIRLVVMMYVKYPLSLRNVEDLLAERGIDICHETGAVLVEQVWPDVRRRDPPKAGATDEGVHPLEVASGRGLRDRRAA